MLQVTQLNDSFLIKQLALDWVGSIFNLATQCSLESFIDNKIPKRDIFDYPY